MVMRDKLTRREWLPLRCSPSSERIAKLAAFLR